MAQRLAGPGELPEPAVNGPAISARQLSRQFGKVIAVDSVDLEIPGAEIYGFLGPNGSGKSTTIRMLCGLLTPSHGQVSVLGLEIPRDAEKLRRTMGYMPQTFSLYRDLSVAENMGFIAQIQGLNWTERRQRTGELMAKYDLADMRKRRAGDLSGGERQRLSLAAAVLNRPRLLLLDEPTSAVDPRTRRDFWESLFELVDQGTTILVSTHYMDEAERCHRLAILSHGRLVAEGAPSTLARDINVHVVEIESHLARAARAQLELLPWVKSVAQLGSRLHALVDISIEQPAQAVSAALAAGQIEARVSLTHASLEDVFVAATGFGKSSQ